jgi:putative two-component system response regulator
MTQAALPRVLIVDDEPMNLKVLVDLLRPNYTLVVARDGFQALERLKATPLPDLALIDVMMPDMTGLELCRRMRMDARLAEVPVIFVSALGQTSDETEGFESGAVDYITKPISPSIVQARVRTHVALRRATRALSERNQTLEEIVDQRTRELAETQDLTIQALASLVEARDNETGGHVVRSQRYVRLLGAEMRRDPRFEACLTQRDVELMAKAAPLHDIGKVGIPDAILQKPGKLTAEEYEVMKTHTIIGRRALSIVSGENTKPSEFLRFAIEITGSHHEKWEGTGYPEALAGEAIPLSARLMALADVYDALTCERVYKRALSHAEAKAIIETGRGGHFDPGVVDAFLRCERAFDEIAVSLRASDGEPRFGAFTHQALQEAAA